jgi:hypothetical protein
MAWPKATMHTHRRASNYSWLCTAQSRQWQDHLVIATCATIAMALMIADCMLPEKMQLGQHPLASNDLILPQPPLQCWRSVCICVPFPTLQSHRGFRQLWPDSKARVALVPLTCLHHAVVTISCWGLYMTDSRTQRQTPLTFRDHKCMSH